MPDDVKAVAVARARAPADPRARGALGRARRRRRRRRGARTDPRPGDDAMTRGAAPSSRSGSLVYVVAWVFGSTALYPVAAGLVLAVAARGRVGAALAARAARAAGTARRATRSKATTSASSSRSSRPRRCRRRRSSRTSVPGRLGERRVELVRVARRRVTGRYDLTARAARPLPVRDRAPVGRGPVRARADGDRAGRGAGARRLPAPRRRSSGRSRRAARARRRAAGSCCGARRASTCTASASTQPGESLRHVHWRSTAHRGQLMVKELEDAPRDETVVLLDGDAASRSPAIRRTRPSTRRCARPARSSRRRCSGGRRCVLVVNSAAREVAAR